MARVLEEQKKQLQNRQVQGRVAQVQKPGAAQTQSAQQQPAQTQQTRREADKPTELHTGGNAAGQGAAGTNTQTAGQAGSAAQTAQQMLDEKLGSYSGQYRQQAGTLLDQILNREEFQYDPASDPTYQALRESWLRDGNLAMQDTMAQGAQLTGGYGNSYAQMAGQQAYQGYARGLNEMIPELEANARTAHDAETAALLQNYGLLMEQDEQEYGRYLDALEQHRYDQEWAYQRERDALSDRRYDEEWAYQQERDRLGDSRYDQEWEYQQGRDALEDSRYNDERDYQRQRDEAEDARYAEEWAYAMEQDERDYALNLALAAYEMGDDSLIRAMGIDPKEYVAGSGSGGSSGGSGGGSDELQIDADSLAEVERYYGNVDENQIEALIAAGIIEEEVVGDTIYYRIVTKEKPKAENPTWEHGGHTFTGW